MFNASGILWILLKFCKVQRMARKKFTGLVRTTVYIKRYWLVNNLFMAYLKNVEWTDGDNQTEADGDEEQGKKGRQKRGGKALLKPKKKEVGERFVKLARANRGKKKYVTG